MNQRQQTVKRRPRVSDHVRLIDSPARVFRVVEIRRAHRRSIVVVVDAHTDQRFMFRADQVETLSAAFMADWSL